MAPKVYRTMLQFKAGRKLAASQPERQPEQAVLIEEEHESE